MKNKEKLLKEAREVYENDASVMAYESLSVAFNHIINHELVTIKEDEVEERKVMGYELIKKLEGYKTDVGEKSFNQVCFPLYKLSPEYFKPIYTPKEKSVDEKLDDILDLYYGTSITSCANEIKKLLTNK